MSVHRIGFLKAKITRADGSDVASIETKAAKQSPDRIEELVKIFIQATKVSLL